MSKRSKKGMDTSASMEFKSSVDLILESKFKEMKALLAKYDKGDESLIAKQTEQSRKESITLPWVLPPEAYLSFHKAPDDDGFYLPGHEELDESAKDYTYIDISGEYLRHKEKDYSLGKTLLVIKTPYSSEPYTLYLSEYWADSPYLIICAGSINSGKPKAFFEAKCENGEIYYFELEEFCSLSITYETLDFEEGVFTWFDKRKGILITKLAVGFPNFKEAILTNKTQVKPQGLLNKINSRAEQFIMNRFDEMVTQYTKSIETDSTKKSRQAPRNPGDLITSHLLRSDKQVFTQAQMKDRCRMIRLRGQRDKARHYTEINFREMRISDHGPFLYMGVSAKLLNDTMFCFDIQKTNTLEAAIIAGDLGGFEEAFLVVKREDGEECIFQLESFSILAIHYKGREHWGTFITFNGIANGVPSMHFKRLCETYPKGKLPLRVPYTFDIFEEETETLTYEVTSTEPEIADSGETETETPSVNSDGTENQNN